MKKPKFSLNQKLTIFTVRRQLSYKAHYSIMAFLILFSMPSAFADVDLVGVDIFCDNEILLGFTILIPFLEICPIEGIPPLSSTPEVSIADAAGIEGSLGEIVSFIFPVTLSSPSASTVSVDFSTLDDTATSLENDYFESFGTVNFVPGDTFETIVIKGLGDNEVEIEEKFKVLLSNCINCVIFDGVGVATIIDDGEFLPQDMKDAWESAGLTAQAVNALLLPSLPQTLVLLPYEFATCISAGVPTAGIACIPFAVNFALLTIPPSVEILAFDLAADPPDNNFEEVVILAPFEVFESEGLTESGVALVNLLNVLSEQSALQQAFLTSYERYLGAALANEQEFVILQLSSAKLYSDLLIENQLELQDAFMEYSLVLQNGISTEELEDLQNRLETEGFSDIEIQSLLDSGYSLAQIEEIKDAVLDLSSNDITNFSDSLTDAADSYESLSTTLQIFSDELDELLRTVLTQTLQNVIDELNSIISENPGTPLADKVEDALATTQNALFELNKTPPNIGAAAGLGSIEGAVGSLEDAIKDNGLDQTQGEQLIDKLLDVSRQIATNAISVATNTSGSDAGKISSANTALANGDSFRTPLTSFGDFKNAAAEYKVAISEAMGALP